MSELILDRARFRATHQSRRFEEKRVEELLRVIRSIYARVVDGPICGQVRSVGEEALDGLDRIHRAAESLLKQVPP